MPLFHRHHWVETERHTARSVRGFRIERCSEHMYERLAFGVTTIVLACAVCGDRKTLEILGSGDAVDPVATSQHEPSARVSPSDS
jgi:hypothetical protein